MDDDFGALKWYSKLLMRDPRTTVMLESNHPTTLVRTLEKRDPPDAILLDVEYQAAHPPVEELVAKVLTSFPNTAIICISQYIDLHCIDQAVIRGVNAYLQKDELGLGIATAVKLSCRRWFVMTPSVRQTLIEKQAFQKRPSVVLSWEPPARLTPSLHESFELRVMYRLRAPLAALKIHKAPQTVEKYVNVSYARLEDRWVDDLGLEGINWENLSPEDRAFVLYTQPRVKIVN